MNGRINPELNDFTSITGYRGRAVVDYHIIRQNELNTVKRMEVKSCVQLVNDNNWEGLLGTNCHIPDHSLLPTQVELASATIEHINHDRNLGSQSVRRQKIYRKVGENYMHSETVKKVLPQMIQELEKNKLIQEDIDNYYQKLTALLLDEVERSQKQKGKCRTNTKFKKYWDLELNRQWNEMKCAERDYRKCVCNQKLSGCLYLKKRKFQIEQKCFDKMLKRKRRRHEHGLLIEIEKCNTKNPSAFWSYLRKLGPNKHNEIPWEVNVNGVLVTDREQVLRKWQEDFENLYKNQNCIFNDAFKEELLTQDQLAADPPNQELNKPISLEEVRMAVNASKTGKAVGRDLIANEILKNNNVIELLLVFFRKCFGAGKIPQHWKHSIIHPIPKERGYLNDPLKFRGLSLQSCIYKIFSSIVNSRIVNYLEQSNVINDEQNGFRSEHSCSHHIFVLTSLIRNACKLGNNFFAAFIDFQKAFDLTDRQLLYHKLRSYGITGNILTVIKEMHTDTISSIRINGVLTEPLTSEQGVKQGDNIAPTCFSAYINGLSTELKKSSVGVELGSASINHLAYADNIVLLAKDSKGLQELLDICSVWCKNWRVQINVQKTTTMEFGKKRRTHVEETFMISNTKLENVSTYQYLGVTLDSKADEFTIANQLASSGSRALGTIDRQYQGKLRLGVQKLHHPVSHHCGTHQ